MTPHQQALRPGEQFLTTQFTLEREDILSFAEEFDPQPYHLDPKAAEASIFGGLCASGWQVAAIMMRLLTDALRERHVPVQGIRAVPAMRWKRPVFEGDTLRARVTITGHEDHSGVPGCGSTQVDVEVLNQHDKPAILLSAVLLVAREESARAS